MIRKIICAIKEFKFNTIIHFSKYINGYVMNLNPTPPIFFLYIYKMN